MAKPLLRLRAVQAAFALGGVVLIGRAAQVQLQEGEAYAARAAAQRTERRVLPARRGALYDRNGTTLAATQEVFHVGVAPNELRRREQDGRVIADHLEVPQATMRRALQRRYAHFEGPFSSTQVAALRGMPGVHLSSELVRFYPAPGLAQPILGHPPAPGRVASGIERVYDSLLVGADGSAVLLRDRWGNEYESPSRLDAFPVPGHDLVLTLDAELQEIVEEALRGAIDRLAADGGEVVVMNPASGELLAVAGFDAQGRATSKAFTDVFEPGSTAKLFAVGALLEFGVARIRDSVWAEQGEYTVGARTIRDEEEHGWLSVPAVIRHSSNIGVVKLAARLTPAQQYRSLRAFGLGTPTGVEYPAESPGILKRPSSWSGTTAASVAMGYEVAVTPLQLAQAYAAIANGGLMMRPMLVREVRTPSGEVAYRQRPEAVRRVVAPEVARALRAMLRAVVYQGGTGETAALTSYEVAGKTGTARRAGSGGYIPGAYIATFASLFPADDPQLVMVVKLDDPKGAYARITAAPVTREVLQRLLGARTGAIDRSRLAQGGGDVDDPPPPSEATTPVVVAWPPPEEPAGATHATVPDVRGLGLREAVQRIHQAGLRVRVDGWGRVVSSDPGPGATVPARALVTVVAREAEPR